MALAGTVPKLCGEPGAAVEAAWYGVFGEATGRHAIEALAGAIAEHGEPASILADRDVQFYSNEAKDRKRVKSEFEKGLEIRHMLCGVGPQTGGKLGRFHGEIQKRKRLDWIDELVRWYNYDRPHGSLDRDIPETPVGAFVHKMTERGETAKDEATEEMCHAR